MEWNRYLISSNSLGQLVFYLQFKSIAIWWQWQWREWMVSVLWIWSWPSPLSDLYWPQSAVHLIQSHAVHFIIIMPSQWICPFDCVRSARDCHWRCRYLIVISFYISDIPFVFRSNLFISGICCWPKMFLSQAYCLKFLSFPIRVVSISVLQCLPSQYCPSHFLYSSFISFYINAGFFIFKLQMIFTSMFH